MKYQSINDSKLSELENEEDGYEYNDNLRTYVQIINKREKLKTNEGYLVDFYTKDPILDIGYIINYPLWIVNSNNYMPYAYININKEHQSLINNGKFCGFIYKKNFYLLVYEQNHLVLYSCNYINDNNKYKERNNCIFNFNLNADNQNIINIKFLPNDLGKAYFIVVTDIYDSYLLHINIDNNNINFNFEQCNNKYNQSILAKSFSSLWPFNSFISSTINNISNCFIISPYRQLKKNNNLYTYYNTLYILSNHSLILKKIIFYINNNSINSQIEDSKDLSKEVITHLNSNYSNYEYNNNSDINVISTDSYFNEKIKTLLIYCFIIFNDQKYILRIIVDNNFNITFDTLDINSMITNPQVNKGKIFVNNYIDEGILVIPNDIIINFNYNNDQNNANNKGWKSYIHFKKNIIGINKFNQMSVFNLDLFTLDEGIINYNPCLYYSSPHDLRGNYKIEQADHTNSFLSNFLQGQMLPYTTNISNNNQIFNSIYRINSDNNINNISNGGSLNNSFQSQRSQRALKPYEIILNNEKKKEFHIFLDEIIKKYIQQNSYLNKIDEKDEYIINKLESFFNNNQINNREEALNDFLNYINNIINNENTHIEIIEKSKTKAKLLTVEYLQEKYNKLMILYELLKQCKIDGVKIFDYYPDLLNEFFKIFEKIIIGINMRKQENIHLEKIEQEDDEGQKLITLFLENFYREIKNKLGNNKDFNHLLLFGKISNINEELLNVFFGCFNLIFNNNYNKNKYDELNYNEQKDNLLLFIINIIIGINEDIQKLINKFNEDGNNNKNNISKYKDGLWYLSNNNYICNKYLLQIFKDIYLWKTQLYQDSKIDDDIIYLFAEQLHFLFKKYLLLGNNSLKDKNDYMNNQKTINSIILNFDPDKAYELSKKYYDHFTLAQIAFNNKYKYYNDLKDYMKNVLSKKRGHIKYLLQLILEFEIQYAHNSKDNNNYIFNYFEDFDEFENEIKEIVKISKKLENFFNLYRLKKNIETKINNVNGHDLVQDIVLNTKNDDINDFNANTAKIDNLIKLIYIDKTLNLIKHSYLENNENNEINLNMDIFKENSNEDNLIYEILQLCQQKKYKNILNNIGDYPNKTFYERSLQFLRDYFDNYIFALENPNEVKENCYIILFLLNKLIQYNKIQFQNVKEFIGELFHKCIILDNDYIYDKLNDDEEQNEENVHQKINLIYRITAEHSIVIKLAKIFKNFKNIIMDKINEIKEDEMNKNENNRITHLLEFVNILNNLMKPENMDNFNNIINNDFDNKMDEEE